MIVPSARSRLNAAGAEAGGYSLWEYMRTVDDSDLPTVQRHVLSVLSRIAAHGADGVCSGPRVSLPRLARAVGCTDNTVRLALKGLVASGWVKRLSGGTGRRNSYALSPPNPPQGEGGLSSELIHNPPQVEGGTPLTVAGDPPHSCTPVLTLLSQAKSKSSIVARVRARLRSVCPDLDQADDDDLLILIAHLEATGVRDAGGYLHRCPAEDIRRLFIDATEPAVPSGPPSSGAPLEVPGDCEHGFPGGLGLTKGGQSRCPECRAGVQSPRCAPGTHSPAYSGEGRDLEALERLSGLTLRRPLPRTEACAPQRAPDSVSS